MLPIWRRNRALVSVVICGSVAALIARSRCGGGMFHRRHAAAPLRRLWERWRWPSRCRRAHTSKDCTPPRRSEWLHDARVVRSGARYLVDTDVVMRRVRTRGEGDPLRRRGILSSIPHRTAAAFHRKRMPSHNVRRGTMREAQREGEHRLRTRDLISVERGRDRDRKE